MFVKGMVTPGAAKQKGNQKFYGRDYRITYYTREGREDLDALIKSIQKQTFEAIFHVESYKKVFEFMQVGNSKNISLSVISNNEVGTAIAKQIGHLKTAIISRLKPNADKSAGDTMVKTPAFMSPPGFGKTAIIRNALDKAKEKNEIADYVFYDMSKHDPLTAPIGLTFLLKRGDSFSGLYVDNAIMQMNRKFIDYNPLAFMLYYINSHSSSEEFASNKALDRLSDRTEAFFKSFIYHMFLIDEDSKGVLINTKRGEQIIQTASAIEERVLHAVRKIRAKENSVEGMTMAFFALHGVLTSVGLRIFNKLIDALYKATLISSGSANEEQARLLIVEVKKIVNWTVYKLATQGALYYLLNSANSKNNKKFLNGFISYFVLSALYNVYSNTINSKFAVKDESITSLFKVAWSSFLTSIKLESYLNEPFIEELKIKYQNGDTFEVRGRNKNYLNDSVPEALRRIADTMDKNVEFMLGADVAEETNVLVNIIVDIEQVIFPKVSYSQDVSMYSESKREKNRVEEMIYDAFEEDYVKKEEKTEKILFSALEKSYETITLLELDKIFDDTSKRSNDKIIENTLSKSHKVVLDILCFDCADLSLREYVVFNYQIVAPEGEILKDSLKINLSAFASFYANTLDSLNDNMIKYMMLSFKKSRSPYTEADVKVIVKNLFKYWVSEYLYDDVTTVNKLRDSIRGEIAKTVQKILGVEEDGKELDEIAVVFPAQIEYILEKARRDYERIKSNADTIVEGKQIPVYVIFLDEFFTQLKETNYSVILKLWDGLGNRMDKFSPNVLLVLAGNSPSSRVWDDFINIAKRQESKNLGVSADTLEAFLARLHIMLIKPDYSYGVRSTLRNIFGLHQIQTVDALPDDYTDIKVQRTIGNLITGVRNEGIKNIMNTILINKNYIYKPEKDDLMNALEKIRHFVKNHPNPQVKSIFKEIEEKLDNSVDLAVEIRTWMTVIFLSFYFALSAYISGVMFYFDDLSRLKDNIVTQDAAKTIDNFIKYIVDPRENSYQMAFSDNVLLIYYLAASILVASIRDTLKSLGQDDSASNIMNIFGIKLQGSVENAVCFKCRKIDKDRGGALISFDVNPNVAVDVDINNPIPIYDGRLGISLRLARFNEGSRSYLGYQVVLNDVSYREPINVMYIMLILMAISITPTTKCPAGQESISCLLGMFLKTIYQYFKNTSVREVSNRLYEQKEFLRNYYKALKFMATYMEPIRLFINNELYENAPQDVLEAFRLILKNAFNVNAVDLSDYIRKNTSIVEDIKKAYKTIFGEISVVNGEKLKEDKSEQNESSVFVEGNMITMIADIMQKFENNSTLSISDPVLINKIAAGLYLREATISLFDDLIRKKGMDEAMATIGAELVAETATSNRVHEAKANLKDSLVYHYIWYMPFIKQQEKILQDSVDLAAQIIKLLDEVITKKLVEDSGIKDVLNALKNSIDALNLRDKKPFFYYELLQSKEVYVEVLPSVSEVNNLFDLVINSPKVENYMLEYKNDEQNFINIYAKLYNFVRGLCNINLENNLNEAIMMAREKEILDFLSELKKEIEGKLDNSLYNSDKEKENLNTTLSTIENLYISMKFYKSALNNNKDVENNNNEDVENFVNKFAEKSGRVKKQVELLKKHIELHSGNRKSTLSLILKTDLFSDEIKSYIALLLDAFEIMEILSDGKSKRDENVKNKLAEYLKILGDITEGGILMPKNLESIIESKVANNFAARNPIKDKIRFEGGIENVEEVKMEEGGETKRVKIYFPTSFYLDNKNKIVIIYDKMPVCLDQNFRNTRRPTTKVAKSYHVDNAYAIKEVSGPQDLASQPVLANTFFYIHDGTEAASLYYLAYWDSVLAANGEPGEIKANKAMLLIGIKTLVDYFKKYVNYIEGYNYIQILDKMADDKDMHPILLAAIKSIISHQESLNYKDEYRSEISKIIEKVLSNNPFYKPYTEYTSLGQSTVGGTTSHGSTFSSAGEHDVSMQQSKETELVSLLTKAMQGVWIVPVGIKKDVLFIRNYVVTQASIESEDHDKPNIMRDAEFVSYETQDIDSDLEGEGYGEQKISEKMMPSAPQEQIPIKRKRGRPPKYPR